jgi:hypothetical protein
VRIGGDISRDKVNPLTPDWISNRRSTMTTPTRVEALEALAAVFLGHLADIDGIDLLKEELGPALFARVEAVAKREALRNGGELSIRDFLNLAFPE